MIGYTMVGTTNLQRATRFYDALLAHLGLAQVEANETYTAYAPTTAPDAVEFYVTKPFDAARATAGNGSMLAFLVPTRGLLELFHKAGLANGGGDEGSPGSRPSDATVHYAYIRDPDGNKICAYCEHPD